MAWACRNRGQSGAARFFQYPAFGARHRYLRCALLEAARAAAILPLHQEGPGAGCSESFAVNPSRQIGSFRPRLLTHPGVGPVTALATEVFLSDPNRFATANQVASYIGMIPCEHSRGKRQRLGKITKARQLAAALSVDGSDDACGAERPGAETLLPSQAHPKRNGQGEGRGGPQTGHPAVDHDARPD
ncbi:MAG: hypothetical protein DMG75_10800 [Acidobacteria bacterium]|nr:MAG: hypothetical protein DMG75_10800 [Acidobacteriota bacterium]